MFLKHQKPHPKEKESDLPDMPKDIQSEDAVKRSGKGVPKNLETCINHEKVITSPAESLLLNVDVMNDDCCLPHNEVLDDNNNAQSANELDEIVTDTKENRPMDLGTRAVDWAEKNWGKMIPKGQADSICAWCDEFFSRGSPEPEAVVIEGLRCCLAADVRNMYYLRTALTDWRENGVLTVAQIEARESGRE